MIMKIQEAISTLIETAGEFGLEQRDIINSKELLENREYGLALDIVVTQLYEYDIEINLQLYLLVAKIAEQMNITEDKYSFLNKLIRSDGDIPKSVKDKLSKLLSSLDSDGRYDLES